MTRFLVIFSSHPTPPVDMTVVDVTASCVLSALLTAKREVRVQHAWVFARAIPWPIGCRDVDEATKKVSSF